MQICCRKWLSHHLHIDGLGQLSSIGRALAWHAGDAWPVRGQYGNVLDNPPNGDFIAATLVRGIEAIKADQKASTAPKKKAVKPKAPPPTNGGNVSPPVENAANRKQKQKESIKRKGPLSANDLAAYLSD